MASWRRLLDQMVADENPRSYRFDEAASILIHIGFVARRRQTGSHRTFRIVVPDPASQSGERGVTIGLVDSGKGTLKPIYIREMIRVLRENNLLPSRVEEE